MNATPKGVYTPVMPQIKWRVFHRFTQHWNFVRNNARPFWTLAFHVLLKTDRFHRHFNQQRLADTVSTIDHQNG
jgi:hypothetical protein